MKIKNITLYGGGLIGSGWATHLLHHYKEGTITIYDLNEDCLQNCRQIVEKNLSFLQEEGVFDEATKQEYLKKLIYTTDVETAVKDADLIIENGPEKLEIKQSMIAKMEEFCRDDAIITSSTSGIMANLIAAKAKHPERIIGAHPYHPVYLLPLLEIVKNDKLDESYLNTALEFFRAVDKKPVVLQKECPGYIATHLMTCLSREAMNLIVNGVCTMEDIDDAFTYGPGMRYGLMGIFMTLQLGGGDGGIDRMVNGPIGAGAEKIMQSFANWETWPQEVRDYMAHIQQEMDAVMAKRDDVHGHNNGEIESFRDKGLVRLLQHHHMI